MNYDDWKATDVEGDRAEAEARAVRDEDEAEDERRAEAIVITYHAAYTTDLITLCERCSADEAVLGTLPTLGPVSHGRHHGRCDGCDDSPA